MDLSEDDLANELRSFARRFVESRRFEDTAAMLDAGGDAHEYHNESEESKYFEVEASPTYRDTEKCGEYIAVLVSAMGAYAKGKLGSVYSPLSCFAYVYANGQVPFSAIGNGAAYRDARDF